MTSYELLTVLPRPSNQPAATGNTARNRLIAPGNTRSAAVRDFEFGAVPFVTRGRSS